MKQSVLVQVRDILAAGKLVVNRDSSTDYVEAAAFIFDNGLFYCRDEALKMVSKEIAERPSHG